MLDEKKKNNKETTNSYFSSQTSSRADGVYGLRKKLAGWHPVVERVAVSGSLYKWTSVTRGGTSEVHGGMDTI